MKAISMRKMLKRNKFLFFTYMKLTDKLYHTNFRDYLLNSHDKPKEKIKKELKLMRDYWDCEPMNYYRYRLYEREIAEEDLLDYIPQYYFYNYYVPSVYSDDRIREAGSKIRMNEYFISHGINTPYVTATILERQIVSDGKVIDFQSLVNKLISSTARVFFLKPDNGQGGKGILRIEKRDYLYVNNELLTWKLLYNLAKKQDYIIQEGIVQRSDIMAINPTSVNTLRVITQNFKGKPAIAAASMRIGRNNAFVDNISAGGIYAGIDLKTGSLARYAYDIRNNKKFDRHPDTGFIFGNFRFPDWQSISSSILDIASRAAEYPDVAWDIAILEDRITAIELNLNYGIDIQAIVGGLRRKMNVFPVELT